MSHPRHYVGPSWPPPVNAYDYVLRLCPSDLAWEFLRRNPRYQRDYWLTRRGCDYTRRLRNGRHLTRIRRHNLRCIAWGLHPFVDPALPAPDAPLSWVTNPATQIIEAISHCPVASSANILSLADLSSAKHILVGPTYEQDVLLRDSFHALTLRLYGARSFMAPVCASFLIAATPEARHTLPTIATALNLVFQPKHTSDRSGERLLLRDAVVSLDARCAGASYRETAALIFGAEYTRAQWGPGKSTWLKERMRHARAKGETLRDGGYRKLLQEGCRCSA